jgi:very-short-patch-repair endonuclease
MAVCLYAGESVWEDKIFRWVVDSGEPAPDRQVCITIDGVNYRIDLGYVDLKIAIEFDGYDHQHLYSRHISDRDRMSELQLAGWLVLPLTAANSRQVVIRRVREARALRLAER